jgi:hypothetical protein
VKSTGLTRELRSKLSHWRVREGSGIPGVGVKSLDIGKNTNGEGSFLAHF